MPQAYRHGVLMGNWNEDAFGSAIIRTDVRQGDQPLTDDQQRSFSHSCYTTAGHAEASNTVLSSHIHPRCPPSLSSQLLLAHTAHPAATAAQQYTSEHSRAFGARSDDRAMEKAAKARAEANKGREAEEERELRTRQRTYKTVASESYSVEHSIAASDEKRSPFLVKPGTLTLPAAVYNLQLRK